MNNSTLVKKIIDTCHKQHDQKHFYLDKNHKVLSRLSKTIYASELQEAIYKLIQSENVDPSYDSYGINSLINTFLLVGGSINAFPQDMIDRLVPSDKMRLSWIKHQFSIVYIWQDLVQKGLVRSVDFKRAEFLEKNKRNIMGEIILLDILQDSLILVLQGQFDELAEINDDYFLEVLQPFLDFMTIPVSIEDTIIDLDKNSFICQLNIEGKLYTLAVDIYSNLIDEIYLALNSILNGAKYKLRFVQIDLISDSGFLFGDFDIITQTLSSWSIPWLQACL